jgi:hypothetical protein
VTPVHYQRSNVPGLSDTPWVAGRPGSAGLLGALLAYPSSLRDPRVNRSDGLVLWRHGESIRWTTFGTLWARRLDGHGSFSTPLGYDRTSSLRFPSTGCWRLTLWKNSGRGPKIASVVARVVDRPKQLACAATPLEARWAIARPRSSGIRGGWPWQTSGPVHLTTRGHDGDKNMNVLWSVPSGGRDLELVGTQLDGDGRFRQDFPQDFSQRGAYESTVDIPVAGCWLFRLRTGRLAGVLVVRAVDAHG